MNAGGIPLRIFLAAGYCEKLKSLVLWLYSRYINFLTKPLL